MIKKSIDASLLFSIINLTSQIRQRGDLIYKFAGLTTQQYVILLHLAKDPNIPFIENGKFDEGMLASELAESLKISRPGITNLIRTLIQKELVQQIEDPIDRRKKRLALTDTSRALMLELEPIRNKANSAFLAQFTEDEKNLFMNFIERCSVYAKDQLDHPEKLEELYDKIGLPKD